jgi:hypothetical protein
MMSSKGGLHAAPLDRKNFAKFGAAAYTIATEETRTQ